MVTDTLFSSWDFLLVQECLYSFITAAALHRFEVTEHNVVTERTNLMSKAWDLTGLLIFLFLKRFGQRNSLQKSSCTKSGGKDL